MTAGEVPADRLARLRDNIAATQAKIEAACRQAGRPPTEVRLVAVTKYASAEITGLVAEAGLVDLAESRPQAIWSKAEALAGTRPAVRWHLIGHLQRNKVRRTLPLLALLHSLDSLRLLEAIGAEAARSSAPGCPLDLLVEVNLTADPCRSGALPADVPALVAAAAATPHVRLRGLMGMAARPDGDDADARRDFARLRGLRDELARSVADPAQLTELSMGMSGDFEAAILEGATIVRIGSALFEGVA